MVISFALLNGYLLRVIGGYLLRVIKWLFAARY